MISSQAAGLRPLLQTCQFCSLQPIYNILCVDKLTHAITTISGVLLLLSLPFVLRLLGLYLLAATLALGRSLLGLDVGSLAVSGVGGGSLWLKLGLGAGVSSLALLAAGGLGSGNGSGTTSEEFAEVLVVLHALLLDGRPELLEGSLGEARQLSEESIVVLRAVSKVLQSYPLN